MRPSAAEEEYRPLLFSIAYGMTGSVGDAVLMPRTSRAAWKGPSSVANGQDAPDLCANTGCERNCWDCDE